jgi:hypothetical protein
LCPAGFHLQRKRVWACEREFKVFRHVKTPTGAVIVILMVVIVMMMVMVMVMFLQRAFLAVFKRTEDIQYQRPHHYHHHYQHHHQHHQQHHHHQQQQQTSFAPFDLRQEISHSTHTSQPVSSSSSSTLSAAELKRDRRSSRSPDYGSSDQTGLQHGAYPRHHHHHQQQQQQQQWRQRDRDDWRNDRRHVGRWEENSNDGRKQQQQQQQQQQQHRHR